MNLDSTTLRALRNVALAAVALALPLLTAGTASARSLPAQAGHAYNADVACFGEAWGSAKNNCSGAARYWITPLVVDAAGYVNPTITVYAPTSSNTVGCYAYGVQSTSTNSFTFWQSNTLYPSQFGVAAALTPTGAYVPGGGYLMLVCAVSSGGQINGVSY